jgi:hypothetical protein
MLDHPLCEVIPVFQPSRFYPCPSRRDNFKAARELDVLENLFGIVFPNFWFIFGEEISDFRLCCGRFLHESLSLF